MKNSRRNRSLISRKRRNNAILYPIYKMFSWDLLSFYSIEYLFYTITKGISPSQVLIMTSVYMICKILFQIPSVAISDYLGKKKSIILGNFLLVIYILLLIISPNIIWILLANMICAFGYDLKGISEGNLLYDSVATKGGDGIYTKIDSKGASGYYILDTGLSIIAGYLFVINNYIPMFICMAILLLSTILSFKFHDIHRGVKKKSGEKFSKFIKGYSNDILDSFKFIKKSKRIKAYLIFASIFYGFIKVISTYRSNLLTDIGVSAEQFSIIYAVLSLIAALSVSYSRKVQRHFKNKTLMFISLSHIISTILVGVISVCITDNLALPFILIFYIIIKICDSQWYVTEYTYLKNFTKHETRNKITFTYELVTCVSASLISLVGALVLDYINIKYTFIFVGLLFLAIMIIVLDYMKTRFGLDPKEYKKEDIEFPTRK